MVAQRRYQPRAWERPSSAPREFLVSSSGAPRVLLDCSSISSGFFPSNPATASTARQSRPRTPVCFWPPSPFTYFRIICVTGACGRLYSVSRGRPYRLAVRTPPFHGGGTGSIPVRVAIPINLAAYALSQGQSSPCFQADGRPVAGPPFLLH